MRKVTFILNLSLIFHIAPAASQTTPEEQPLFQERSNEKKECLYPEDGSTEEELLRAANHNMYKDKQAKKQGRS